MTPDIRESNAQEAALTYWKERALDAEQRLAALEEAVERGVGDVSGGE